MACSSSARVARRQVEEDVQRVKPEEVAMGSFPEAGKVPA